MISSEACSEFPPGSLDILYIDGNHRYDFVLADLERWNSKLAEGGCIILNDCYVSHIGKRQHISVLEAVSTFIKLSDWRPAALVNRQFTDVVLTRESHVKKAKFDIKMRLIAQGTGFIELPASLIHSLSHRLMRIETDEKNLFREYMSFGD
jgi:Methyltransferase domain